MKHVPLAGAALAALAAASAQANHGGPVTAAPQTIVIQGHYDNAVGTQDAASAGTIRRELLESRPAHRIERSVHAASKIAFDRSHHPLRQWLSLRYVPPLRHVIVLHAVDARPVPPMRSGEGADVLHPGLAEGRPDQLDDNCARPTRAVWRKFHHQQIIRRDGEPFFRRRPCDHRSGRGRLACLLRGGGCGEEKGGQGK